MWLLLMGVISVEALGDCPRFCECKWRSGKESVLCPDAGLTSVPIHLVSATQLLDLTNNRLVSLGHRVFAQSGLINLQRLYLRSCSLESIEATSFASLINLVDLDLSRNHLVTVPSHAFDPLRELRELRLSGNPITKVLNDAFTNLPNLVELIMNECKINYIETRAFAGLESSLEYLQLNNNRLRILHAAALAPLRNLNALELAGNFWECTCVLRPLRDWMIKKNLPATKVPDCNSPPRLRAISWNKITLEDLACQPEVSTTSSKLKGLEGADVTFVCRVKGVPAPLVRWSRAGRLLSNTTSINVNSGRAFILRSEGQTSNLTIKSAEMQDAGSYICGAENRAGKAELTFNLLMEKRSNENNFSGAALIAGLTICAVIIFIVCLVTLCAYEVRKRRQLDRWNEQIVFEHRRDGVDKINISVKDNMLQQRTLTPDSGRKRGDYQNVPSQDPEEVFVRCQTGDLQNSNGYLGRDSSRTSPPDTSWRHLELSSNHNRPISPKPDLHIPLYREYDKRSSFDFGSNHSSTGATNNNFGYSVENNRIPKTHRYRRARRTRDSVDADLTDSDNENNMCSEAIEMNDLGNTSYLRDEFKRHQNHFSTMPRMSEGDSRSPLLNSRRNSSGGESGSLIERPYERSRQRTAQRSNSFLDLSNERRRVRKNPSLPTSPSKKYSMMPSATQYLEGSTSQYPQRPLTFEDLDLLPSDLEEFLAEYITLKNQFDIVTQVREQMQRSIAAVSEKGGCEISERSREGLTEAPMADAPSALTLSPSEYVAMQQRQNWISSALYRN
ncbi:hypothetical protein K1T71_008679 [Dendrolimus kikuchii]|uniref:Uncharacterized protein n=1 Tax=Dendrolimus kikuchii TaxID=765133 RepID=A0ACC1CVM9_9NEOP|nr:hypothetical protein K1T71_008679 [Dendrolimus kikuchii]